MAGRWGQLGWVSSLVLFVACGSVEEQVSDGGPSGPVTFERDIRPLMESRCLGCHVEGGAGPFSLEGWANVEDLAPQVVSAVVSELMPPWPVDDACHPLRDVAGLDEAQRALFQAWADDGFERGDPDDFVPLERATLPALGKPQIAMTPMAAYTPGESDLVDEYRCFLLPDGFDEDTYVTAMDIVPGTLEAVHHVQIHTIPAAGAAQAMKNDVADAVEGYQCFGGPNVTGSFNMFSWRPGSEAVRFDEGDAALVEKGTRVVIQVHYNVHDPEKTLAPDLTTIKFWTLPKGELPDHIVRRAGITSQQLNIPAGEPNYVTEQTHTMRSVSSVGGFFGIGGTYVQGEIIGQTPHMHMFGTRLSVELTRKNGKKRCLVNAPRWDFEWQLDYLYASDAAVSYDPEDTVTVHCEYDNSPEHQPRIGSTQRDPISVRWGEGSLDEMCLNYVWLRFEREAYFAALAK